MTLGLAFWILMLLWLVCSLPNNSFLGPYAPWGGWVLGFLLFLLLGWHAFGPPLHG